MVYEVKLNTNSKTELLDITEEVVKIVKQAEIEEGFCVLFVPHTTAGITINENVDSSVTKDMTMEMERIIPFREDYKHLEGNSAAHVKSTLVGVSERLIIDSGRLLLGTWQGIFFCEFDGPRERKVKVKLSSV
ncbi:secondary thiamine-phosphate synthase enzyme YjbQ [Fuchsiella alkaliacetigena]|uniref:secondary thiamine-phosphate synthase enzyme YjbQ n=1 Tax=Fuchsiella alkaliacetigena TaxID=957042 RepID=UPI00200B825D|nr:secondary thiamine-phosphate synthase enzyme YjbQ [Fuchsiella alkaliacetigena]MCK8825562.1 secondary thiamine-phosphate synthase enzyme YjbQ [Fuchsiella alkaliacetigena]